MKIRSTFFCLLMTFFVTVGITSAQPAIVSISTDYEILRKKLTEKMNTLKSREEYENFTKEAGIERDALLKKYAGIRNDLVDYFSALLLAENGRFLDAEKRVDRIIPRKSQWMNAAMLLKVNLLISQKGRTPEALKLFREIETAKMRTPGFFELAFYFAAYYPDEKVDDEYTRKLLAYPDLPKDFETRKANLEKKMKQRALTSQAAMDFPAEYWLNSEPLSLESLKGKAVVIDFWSPSCGSCRQVIPVLVDAYSVLRDNGLMVIGYTRFYGSYNDDAIKKDQITPEEELLLIRGFVERFKIVYPVAVAKTDDVFNRYFIGDIPTLILIDKKGIIRKIIVGSGDQEKIAEEIRNLLQ